VNPATVRYISILKKQEEYTKNISLLMNSPKFGVMETENNLEMGLGVNESLMSIGLYKLGNTYDFSSHYTSSENDAVEFANELFKHYKNISDEVDKDGL
jgi:predicted transcriptional regulator